MKNPKTPYEAVLSELDILKMLNPFQVYLVGTPPLGIQTENSDIDLICHYKIDQFKSLKLALQRFQHLDHWSFNSWEHNPEIYICSFSYRCWEIEVFCSTQPIIQQYAYRHFHIEKRLLELANTKFKTRILELKQQGIKTEPAFAQALNLQGNPYIILSELFDTSTPELKVLLDKNGFLNLS
ncbi:DUF4269 domain-containing protein [Acinetobacter sp. 3657]|uniref:DUF4269 domain-containing protein n=1 Tax=Acinetobacter sp. 3657 TaxID=2817764 RepID=UPI0028647EEA|nr:hypothetical protein [Prolinoborus sp. 3657]